MDHGKSRADLYASGQVRALMEAADRDADRCAERIAELEAALEKDRAALRALKGGDANG